MIPCAVDIIMRSDLSVLSCFSSNTAYDFFDDTLPPPYAYCVAPYAVFQGDLMTNG